MNADETHLEIPVELLKELHREIGSFAGTPELLGLKLLPDLNGNGKMTFKIRPAEYPEDMFGFYKDLAAAEINLCDKGYKVRLLPDIKQRLIIVANVPGTGEIAIQSEDGNEFEDLAKILGIEVVKLDGTLYEGYAYDSQSEKEEVLIEAKKEHPEADFSKVA